MHVLSMCLSCSVNLTLASQSCTTVIVSLDDCTLDQGGDGVYVGDIFGLDYGLPGGWFAGGGNPSASEANRTLGGGGMRGSFTDNTVKNGAANTGGGGMGCEGSTNSQFLGTITRYEMCVCVFSIAHNFLIHIFFHAPSTRPATLLGGRVLKCGTPGEAMVALVLS